MVRKKHNRRRKKATKVVKQIRIEKAIDKLKLKLNMDEEEFNCAKQRAQSRAAILESLQRTYKKVKSISTSYTAASSQVNIKRSDPQDSISDDFHSASVVDIDDIEGLLSIDGTISSRAIEATTNGSNDGRTILNNIVDAVLASIFDDESCGTTTPHNNNNNNNNFNHRNSTDYMRMKQFYKDAIRGKALILQNTAIQLKASQYKHKHKNIHKRRNILSNIQMKKLHRCDPLQLPPSEFIQEMHQHWWSYAKQVVFNSQSEAQLQARYHHHHYHHPHHECIHYSHRPIHLIYPSILCLTYDRVHVMELVGARITILDAIVKQLIGSSGIITACSLNCFYVALDDIDQNKEDDEKAEQEEDYSAVTAVDAIKLHKRKVDTVSYDIKVADAGSASSIVGNNNSNNTHIMNNIVSSIAISDTECLHDHDHDNKKKKKKASMGGDTQRQTMKATQLVRAHVVIGVLLPVLVRGKRTHSSSSSTSSASSCDTTTATSSSSSSSAGNSGGRDDDPLTEDVQVAVLYGKRFMPQAL
jgi:hypothetical protein